MSDESLDTTLDDVATDEATADDVTAAGATTDDATADTGDATMDDATVDDVNTDDVDMDGAIADDEAMDDVIADSAIADDVNTDDATMDDEIADDVTTYEATADDVIAVGAIAGDVTTINPPANSAATDSAIAGDVTTINPATDNTTSGPSIEILEQELGRERHKRNYIKALRGTVASLLIVAAAAVLVAMLVLPILQVTGTSMTETLQDRDIVVALRGTKVKTGDLVAFYYNNNILIKRVIATEGQWVNITDDGTVYVDNVALEEPYLTEKAKGECDIQLPYQVPEGKVFMMGDHRATSVDSRSTALGCISTEMIIGRILFRAWPITALGPVS